jgi:hypothetical protein
VESINGVNHQAHIISSLFQTILDSQADERFVFDHKYNRAAVHGAELRQRYLDWSERKLFRHDA